MKLTVDSRVLRELADWATRIAPVKASQPILSGVLLTADGDGLSAEANDYDVWGFGSYPAEVLTAGRVCVGARLLAELAAGMPAGPVEMVLDGSRLTIRGERARATAPTMPVEDYPDPPKTHGGAMLAVSGPLLTRMLGAAARIAANAKIQIWVALRADPDGLHVEASDSYRILACRLPWDGEGPVESREVLLNATSTQAIGDLAKSAGSVLMAFPHDPHGVFSASAAGRRLAVRQMAEGKRIPVERFAGDKPHTFIVGRDEWSDLAERAGRRCVNKLPLRCEIVDGVLTATGGTDDEGSLTDAVPVSDDTTWPSKGATIALNPGYLVSLLDICPTETVQVGMTRPHSALTLVPVGESVYGMTGVIMPVRLPEATK